MKIAYVCADFGIPILGHKGASVHVREMVTALGSQGHDVRVLTPSPGKGNTLSASIRHVTGSGLPNLCLRFTPGVLRRVHPRLPKELREIAYNLNLYRSMRKEFLDWTPDCVYERYTVFNLAGVLIARRFGVPHLLEVNAPLHQERERTIGLTLRPVAERLDRRVFRGTDRVLVVSESLRSYALQHGATRDRVTVLPNGVDVKRFHPRVRADGARARLGLEKDAFVVGFAGSLKTWHGTDVLLEAFVLLREQVPEARLLIVGDGPQFGGLVQHAERLGVAGSVIFTGATPHDAMPSLLGAMDVGAAPYLDVPNFYFSPLKLYEYMAIGLPVVASDFGSIAAFVRPGETGLLAPSGSVAALADVLIRLKRDEALRARLGRAARLEAEQHSWERNAQFVADLARDQIRRATPHSEMQGAAFPHERGGQA